MGHVESDLDTKPLTRAVFHESSKNSKHFEIWSLRRLSDFFKHLASRGFTKLFKAAMIKHLFSKRSLDFTKGVEKRFVAIGCVENHLNKKPLTSAVFHESCSKCSKEFISLQDHF